MPQHDQLVPLHTVSSEVFKVSGGLKCRIKYRMCTKKEKKITVTISFMKEYTHCLENSKLQEFIYLIGVLCHGLCEKTCMYVCCIKKKTKRWKETPKFATSKSCCRPSYQCIKPSRTKTCVAYKKKHRKPNNPYRISTSVSNILLMDT